VDLPDALIPGDVPFDEQPPVAFAEAALVDGRPSKAIAAIDQMTEESLGQPDAYLVMILKARALLARGDLRAARAETDGAAALASSLGLGRARDLTLAAEIAAVAGHEDVASIVARACEAASAIPLLKAQALSALGIARLARREPSSVEPLSAAAEIARRAGIEDPGFAPYLADEAEALTLVMDPSADARIAWLESRAQDLGRAELVAVAARCRASLLASDHRNEAATACLRQALTSLEGSELTLDRARVLLALGSSLRREGHKAAARDALRSAEAAFERAGAGLWTAVVQEEVSRIGGRRRSGTELSDAEWHVARLAAAGRRNREIAAELYLSVRTVESHLSSVFSKLGVRSRTELAAVLSSSET
jgi:DNA-binding NarL/FixJ family response regulator